MNRMTKEAFQKIKHNFKDWYQLDETFDEIEASWKELDELKADNLVLQVSANLGRKIEDELKDD